MVLVNMAGLDTGSKVLLAISGSMSDRQLHSFATQPQPAAPTPKAKF